MLHFSFLLLSTVRFWGKAGFGAVLGGQFCFASLSTATGKRSRNVVAFCPHHPWGIGFSSSCPSILPGSQIISCSQPERRESRSCNCEKNQEKPLCQEIHSHQENPSVLVSFFPLLCCSSSLNHPWTGCSPNPCSLEQPQNWNWDLELGLELGSGLELELELGLGFSLDATGILPGCHGNSP